MVLISRTGAHDNETKQMVRKWFGDKADTMIYSILADVSDRGKVMEYDFIAASGDVFLLNLFSTFL